MPEGQIATLASTLEIPPSGEAFTRFKQSVWDHYAHAPHLALIDAALAGVAHAVESGGELRGRRLMIFTPPRHGKSMTVGRLFPAWFLGRHPDQRVLLISYAAAIVVRHSRFVRNLIRTPRFQGLFPEVAVARDSSSVGSWDIAGRMGGLDAMGIQGSVTGRGAHLLVIDDPVKNQQQAESPDQQEAIWDSYRSDLYTRLEPHGAVVLIMTRWDEGDLAGRLLRQEPDAWQVLRLPALAEATAPAEEGIDPLGRAAGEALWPARYPAEELAGIRATIGARAFAALYQQRPIPQEGVLFTSSWIESFRLVTAPPLARVVVGVDPGRLVGFGQRRDGDRRGRHRRANAAPMPTSCTTPACAARRIAGRGRRCIALEHWDASA
ncbi:MAG: hypothetical protein IPK19_18310 [Chloroflexi bacterium]|nr:hypothetical protein [Chloroflexota bacterium]